MTPSEAIAILEKHNAWRRGAEIEPQSPKDIGEALDLACRWIAKTIKIKPPAKPVRASETPCGKTVYADKKTAESAINLRMGFKNRPEHLRAYHCERCRGWHLTHKVLFA